MSAPSEYRLRIGSREILLLEGPEGWGECSPLPGYPCSRSAAYRSAVAAACEVWPRPRRDRVPVNALVTDVPLDPGRLSGYPCVKVKVGRRDLQSDVAVVEAVRKMVGPDVALRIDANGGWDLPRAERAIRVLGEFGLELAEQPVAGLDDMARLRRRVQVPLAADESVRSVQDARRLALLSAADAIVLKVQPLGGATAALEVAEAAGVPAIVSSMHETSVGVAYGLALAAALPELEYACGLAPSGELVADVVHSPLEPVNGCLRVSRPSPDPHLLELYSEREAASPGQSGAERPCGPERSRTPKRP